jgi:hypothetical protein
LRGPSLITVSVFFSPPRRDSRIAGGADAKKDGTVYLNELDAYVTDRVEELTRGQQHPVTAKPTSIRSFPLARP